MSKKQAVLREHAERTSSEQELQRLNDMHLLLQTLSGLLFVSQLQLCNQSWMKKKCCKIFEILIIGEGGLTLLGN